MPELKQFAMPDVGEGLTEAEILVWHVQPGDTVALNQIIVEIETAKAAVELPCPYPGVVRELHAAQGATVDVGAPIITVDVAPDSPEAPAPETNSVVGIPADSAPHPESDSQQSHDVDHRAAVLVGYGPRAAVPTRRRRRKPLAAQPVAATSSEPGTLAPPPVRKLAKDMGIDLASVTPSGPDGTIIRDDVQNAALSGVPAATASPGTALPPGFDPVTRERRMPIRGIRKMTAQAVSTSAFTAPHVTEFLAVDMTQALGFVSRLKELPEFAGVTVSPLLVAAKALLVAVKRNPDINASWDEKIGEIVVKGYVNLGIAVATDRGLLVPNIKDADTLTLAQLARSLTDAAVKARAAKTPPADLTGGTITITNLGTFGVDTGTPILNPGEAAILCVGAIRPRPWVHQGRSSPARLSSSRYLLIIGW